ncbi:hypothetical protein Hanom_Chr02g00166161 [Helianthus anomalus]
MREHDRVGMGIWYWVPVPNFPYRIFPVPVRVPTFCMFGIGTGKIPILPSNTSTVPNIWVPVASFDECRYRYRYRCHAHPYTVSISTT